jgi:formate dehydrogenase beta subunit
VSLMPLEQRLNSFSKIVHGYDEEAALKESLRCLQCDLRFKISAVKFWADYSSH